MARFCSIAVAYDQAWSDGQDVQVLWNFLSKVSSSEDVSAEEVLDVLLVDQHNRWSGDQPVPLEVYFQSAPKIANKSALRKKLLLEEFGYLEERNRTPEVESFLSQYNEFLSAEDIDELRHELRGDLVGI